MKEFLSNTSKPGACRRCRAPIVGPPNKKYCEACRKAKIKERK